MIILVLLKLLLWFSLPLDLLAEVKPTSPSFARAKVELYFNVLHVLLQ